MADEVRETLEASLADPDAAEAVLVGRLTHPLRQVGFGAPEAGGGEARHEPARPGGQQTAEVTDLDGRRRERAERKVAQAARALEQAESTTRRARQEHEASTEARQLADAEVERIRADLQRAEHSASAAADDERAKRERAERAGGTLTEARQALDRANTDLDSLGD